MPGLLPASTAGVGLPHPSSLPQSALQVLGRP